MADATGASATPTDRPAEPSTARPPAFSNLPREAHAGLVSRLTALTLDVVIVTILAATIVGLALGGAEVMFGRIPAWIQVPTSIAVGLLPVTYFAAAWWLAGQTIGGIAMGIAVRDAATRRLKFPRSLIRAVGGLALAPVWLLGMALVLVDSRRRSLLDIVVGTIVIYVPDRSGARGDYDTALAPE